MPDKVTKLFPKSVTDNVEGMFNTQLVMYAALCILSILMSSRNPEFAIKQAPKNDEDKAVETTTQMEKPVSINDALTSGKFWLISIILFNGLFFGLYMASTFKFAA